MANGPRTMGLGVIAALMLTASTWAAGESPSQVLTELGSGDYYVRQAATEALLQDQTLAEQVLFELFAAAQTAEQRHRLLAVARHHLLRRLRVKEFGEQGQGSLGLSHQAMAANDVEGLTQPAVQVVMVLPGFPAYGRLRPGDLVLAVDAQPLPAEATAEQFRQMVSDSPAGEPVLLLVQRGGSQMEMSVDLANVQALRLMYQSTPLVLRPPFDQAWEELRGRLLLNSPSAVPLGISDW